MKHQQGGTGARGDNQPRRNAREGQPSPTFAATHRRTARDASVNFPSVNGSPSSSARSGVSSDRGFDAPSHRLEPDRIGLLQWFRPGEHRLVEQTLLRMRQLGIRHLRTGISWADYYTPQGEEWTHWLIDRAGREVELLPCFVYTPPSWGEEYRSNAPPRYLDRFGHFVGSIIERHRDRLRWVELWNEPNNLSEWDVLLDPLHRKFARMIAHAAGIVHSHGKRTLLGGLSPIDPNFLSLMHDHGAMDDIDAIGIHGFAQTFEFNWTGWSEQVRRVRERLDYCGRKDVEIWVTETGYSTWRRDDRRQVAAFFDALRAPAGRVYWYSLFDLHPDLATIDGFHNDEREYHFGLLDADGREKLLARLWRQYGLDRLGELAHRLNLLDRTKPQPLARATPEANAAAGAERGKGGNGTRRVRPSTKAGRQERGSGRVLIIGGAGFIGSHLADRICREGGRVQLLDNFSRPGSELNAEWLCREHGTAVAVECADVRDSFALRAAMRGAAAVFHLAAQVEPGEAFERPAHDFDVNARGTLGVLDALREAVEPPLVYAGTTEVYGDLADEELSSERGRWEPADEALRHRGLPESRPLSPLGPGAVARVAADQYVLNHAASYSLRACALRLGRVYGPRQHGTPGHGWLDWHIRRGAGRRIALPGDGRLVRDLLWVDDVVEALLAALVHVDSLQGRAWNVAGGPGFAISTGEVQELIASCLAPDAASTGRDDDHSRVDPPGLDGIDIPRWLVADPSSFREVTGWCPRVAPAEGIPRLVRHHHGAPAASRPAAAVTTAGGCP